jgi:transcriptional regulator with XRE-family HTH domain
MIETGRKFPSVKMLEQIAGALGIDTPELFASGKVVFLPYQDKSVERFYQDIMDEFDDFKARVAGKLRQL